MESCSFEKMALSIGFSLGDRIPMTGVTVDDLLCSCPIMARARGNVRFTEEGLFVSLLYWKIVRA